MKTLLFVTAGNIEEPADFLNTMKEYRPDIFYMAIYCYPDGIIVSSEDRLMDFAGLELSIDTEATAIKAVEQAKQMGAAACVDFAMPDHSYYNNDWKLYKEMRILPEVRNAIKTECAQQDMEYLEILGPDFAADGFVPGALPWPFAQWNSLLYDIVRDRITEYGNNVCFFSSHCFAQRELDLISTVGKALTIQLCHPGLFHKDWDSRHQSSLSTIYSLIVDTKNHFCDLKWTTEQMKLYLEKANLSGRFATWRVPFTMAATSAAVEYAIGYCEGEIESKTDIEAMRQCFRKAMEMYNAGDIGFELNINPEHENNFMFTEDYIVL